MCRSSSSADRRTLLGSVLMVGLVLPAAASAQSSAPDTLAVAALPPAAPATAAPAAAPAAVAALAGSEGFGLRSPDGAFVLRFQGGAQYDGRFFPDDPQDAATDGFDLRRLRSDLRGTVFGDYDFRVNIEFAGNRVDVLDAYLDARFHPALQLRVGKFKEPVGLERLQSVYALTFAERGFPTALAPNRDVGAQLQGSLGGSLFAYQVGIFNGVPDGGSGDQDLSDSKDVAARVFLQPFGRGPVEALRGLGIGVAATVGDQDGTAAAPGLPAPRTTVGRTTFLRYRADGTSAGTVRADGRRTRLSPQGHWYWRNLGLLGEYIRTDTEVRRDTESAQLSQTAWQVAGSWVVTRESPSYRGVIPARAFDLSAGSWGAWEIAVRLQALDADGDAFPLLADPRQAALSASGWTVGVNWYLNRNVRFLANYERTSFDAAPGGVGLPSEGVFVSRFQVAF